MSQAIELVAQVKDGVGTGVARQARRDAFVPGVVYGAGAEPQMVNIEAKVLGKMLHDVTFFTKIISLDLGGKKQPVLARDVQFHPVTDRPMHIDFLRVDENTRVTVAVPLKFVNHDKSPGLKRGGLLNMVVHEVDVVARPKDIPQQIEIDLAGRPFGTSIHLSDLHLGPDVKIAHPERGNLTVANIVAPKRSKGEAAEAAA